MPRMQALAALCRQSIAIMVLSITSLTVFFANANAAGIAGPNDTLVLRSATEPNLPDETREDCFRYLLAVCQTDQTGDRVGVRTAGSLPFERGKATVSTSYDFEVDDDDGRFDTVLTAQVSGNGELNGFLALVAGGLASGSLSVSLIDLGPSDLAGTIEPQVVFQRSLANHELNGTVTTGINFGIKVEAGAPYVGAGASPELGFNVRLQKKVIRDGVNFGFQALVKRGHKYRIRFDLSSVAKRGATTGTAVSQFRLGGPVTDILGTENWLNGVRETIVANLPNLKPESMRIKQGLDWILQRRMTEAEVVNADGSSTTLTGTAQYLRERAAAAGLPTSFSDIVAKRFRQRLPDAVEERIDRPGFRLGELTVTLEPDHVEIAADQTERINEAIRLLLTPQGQRSSSFIECEAPGNSGSNGNGHGNDDCDFPGGGGSGSSGGSSGQGAQDAGGEAVTSMPAANNQADPAAPVSGGGAAGWAGLLAMTALACCGFGAVRR